MVIAGHISRSLQSNKEATKGHYHDTTIVLAVLDIALSVKMESAIQHFSLKLVCGFYVLAVSFFERWLQLISLIITSYESYCFFSDFSHGYIVTPECISKSRGRELFSNEIL